MDLEPREIKDGRTGDTPDMAVIVNINLAWVRMEEGREWCMEVNCLRDGCLGSEGDFGRVSVIGNRACSSSGLR